VAELVDALASGASGGNPVEVQVLSSAPNAHVLLSKLRFTSSLYAYPHKSGPVILGKVFEAPQPASPPALSSIEASFAV
jgi:hypothetical protein